MIIISKECYNQTDRTKQTFQKHILFVIYFIYLFSVCFLIFMDNFIQYHFTIDDNDHWSFNGYTLSLKWIKFIIIRKRAHTIVLASIVLFLFEKISLAFSLRKCIWSHSMFDRRPSFHIIIINVC